MPNEVFVGVSVVIVLGILAQWISWRLHLPSILLLLTFGFLAGPPTGLIEPDAIFGDLLFPLVSISVALILFEGGLTLKLGELREVGRVVRSLVTVGLLTTGTLAAVAAILLLDLNAPVAILFGAILTVTGPTVVLPILRHVRPRGQVNSALKWEGILNDPIGAVLAVLIFEQLITAEQGGAGFLASGLLRTLIVGSITGFAGAQLIVYLLKHRWAPDFLQNAITLATVVAVFASANLLQHESGLFAVTLMGILLANQKKVQVKHLIEFKENLRVLLISILFIVLAARIDIEQLLALPLSSFTFLAVLIFVIRPVAVYLSTLGSDLTWREKVFISALAPRGIVAAAVTSLFALDLTAAQIPDAEMLVPLMFLVILGTIAVSGLSAAPLARWLGLSGSEPQGCLILGANPFARSTALALQQEGFSVLVVDTNWGNISSARMAGIPTYYGSGLSEHALDEMNLEEMGKLLALTSNDEVNSLAGLYYAEVFGKDEVYQLPRCTQTHGKRENFSSELTGNQLFGEPVTYAWLDKQLRDGAAIQATRLSAEFDYDAFLASHPENSVLPLFLVDENRRLVVLGPSRRPQPRPEQVVISLVLDPTATPRADGDAEGVELSTRSSVVSTPVGG